MKFLVDKPSKTILYLIITLMMTMNGDPRLGVLPKKTSRSVVKASSLKSVPPTDYEKVLITKSIPVKHVFTERELIEINVRNISTQYNVEPELIMSMIECESDFNPNCKTGVCVGLMQINPKYHMERATQLGVTNLYDPYGNILVGVDYIAGLIKEYKDPALALMLYNMSHKKAFDMYKHGKISTYAIKVLDGANKYKKGE